MISFFRIFDNHHLFEMEIFCFIRNISAVTFDQFNAYLLNKGINW